MLRENFGPFSSRNYAGVIGVFSPLISGMLLLEDWVGFLGWSKVFWLVMLDYCAEISGVILRVFNALLEFSSSTVLIFSAI